MFNEFTTQLSGENGQAKDADEDKANNGVIVIPTVDDLCEFKKDEVKPETPEYDFSAHTTYLGEDGAAEKLKETALAERQEELDDARGQAVASYNKNLYLDTYSYQRGPSNIPSTGEYTSCIPGTPISQLQPPESLTFDENGVPENYLYCIEGKSTAYYGGYMTATGSPTRPGVVAVDPREIPYGTEMWIVSEDGRYVYGYAIAADTGGFTWNGSGTLADLYFNSEYECIQFGRRAITIYVLDQFIKISAPTDFQQVLFFNIPSVSDWIENDESLDCQLGY